MQVKKYNDYIKEDNENQEQTKTNTIRAIFLISKTGEIVEKSGYIILGNGIVDEERKSWVAAIGEDMKLYTNIGDTNSLFTVVNNNKYNPEKSPQWKDTEGI